MATAGEQQCNKWPHEAHIEPLAARIGEMRDHMDEAGIRQRAAKSQLRTSGNPGGIREVHTQQGDDG